MFIFCSQGIPEEELLRQQQELFQQARLQQAQVLNCFCDGLALDNMESRNTSSCFMLHDIPCNGLYREAPAERGTFSDFSYIKG